MDIRIRSLPLQYASSSQRKLRLRLICYSAVATIAPAPPLMWLRDPLEARAVQQLRLHFARRASEVLVPLNRYCTSLISSSSSTAVSSAATSSRSLSLSSSKQDNTHPPPSLPSFHPSAFLASLKQHGSPLPFRSRTKQKEFYERWLKSPAFGVWMRERDEEFRMVLTTRA